MASFQAPSEKVQSSICSKTFAAQFSEKVGLVISQFNCSICLGIYNNPVTLPCGNTFCRECLESYRESILRSRYQSEGDEAAKQQFSCPTCRAELRLSNRTVLPENPYLKELASLAQRTVDNWERLFGRPYQAPKVNIPLSQSTDASSDFSAPRTETIENEPPPNLSLFGEPFVTKSSVSPVECQEKGTNKKSSSDPIQSPPILSPVLPLRSIQPKADPPPFISPPKVYGRSSDSSTNISKGKGLTFSKPEKDPYEFKGSQSQSQDDDPNLAVVVTKRKSAENKATTKEPSTDQSMPPPPKGKVKRATKSAGTASKSKEPTIDPLSSQNPTIQRMRSIIQAAEQVELVVEDEPPIMPRSRRTSCPQKRIIEVEDDSDEASGGKKLKQIEEPPSAHQKKTVQIEDDSDEVGGKKLKQVEEPPSTHQKKAVQIEDFGPANDILFDSPAEETEPPKKLVNPKPVDKQPSIVSSSPTVSLSLSNQDSVPNVLQHSPAVIKVPIPVDVLATQPVEVTQPEPEIPVPVVERKEMKDESTETPPVSGYFFIFPDGRTAMVAITKYLVDASVQTDSFISVPTVLVKESLPVETQTEDFVKEFRSGEAQTDVPTSVAIEIQTDVFEQPQPTVEAMEICEPPGLPIRDSIVDETSTYWSVPPQDLRTAESQATMKSAQSSLQPSSSLCPESLAVVAALCRSDEDCDDIADTVVANSNDEVDFVGSTPPHDAEVVMASQATLSNQAPLDSVEVVPSSVQSFLRSQELGPISNNLSVLEDKITPGRTLMNLTKITPATELVMPKITDEDNRGLLNNFINLISNQFNGAQAQNSTPSGATLRKFTFTTQEPAPISPPKANNEIPLPMSVVQSSVLPPSQADLPQLLRDARVETSTISLTSSGCTQYEPYFNALKAFCDLFSCRQTNSFLVPSTTHVVLKTLPGHDPFRVCDRTMKFLMAMAARRWVVSIQWVLDSVKEKRVLPEEEYEITGDTSTAPDHCGPSKARSSRVGLFDGMEICCPENSFINQTFTRNDVFQLIELCGGTRVDSLDQFSYRRGTKRIIAMEEPVNEAGQTIQPSAEEMKRRKDMHRRYKAVILSVDWILDSISRCSKIDASLPINAAYRLFPCSNSELAALASNN